MTVEPAVEHPPAWFVEVMREARSAYGRIVACRDEQALRDFTAIMELIATRRPHLAHNAAQALEAIRTLDAAPLDDMATLERCLAVETELFGVGV